MFLKVEPAAKYDGRLPTYHLPKEIGHFSMNSDGKFCDDKHQLKYLAMPKKLNGLHMDLDEGFSKYIYITEDSEEDYSMILRWIVAHQDEVKKHFVDYFTLKAHVDFVCFRGALKVVCSTIYENLNDWSIVAAKYKSTIYLAAICVEDKVVNGIINTSMTLTDPKMSDRGRQMCTWGYKFEQYMTSDTMNSEPNTSDPVNQNEKFYTVMKGKYGKYTLLFGGELDSVDPAHFDVPGHDPNSVLRYVELKTTKILESKKQDFCFRRYKLLKWYLKSFFVGTPRVVCGFKDDDGIVRELSTYGVSDMPEMAMGLWSPAACLNFGIQFLNFVKEVVVKDFTEAEYIFSWKPGTDITYEEIPGSRTLLPEWYTKNVNFA